MTPAQKALFTEYEEYKRAIAELEDKCEALKPALLQLVPEDTSIDTGTGTFTLTKRRMWKYSAETNAMEEDLKTAKRLEEQTGVATATDGPVFIVFKAKKNV